MLIGSLPKALEINGVEYPINTDYRSILHIITMFNDMDLPQNYKAETALGMFYLEEIPIPDMLEAYEQLLWFVDGGEEKDVSTQAKVMDWEQDEKIIFSAVNKLVKDDVRERPYMHWWTFLGYLREVGESTFITVVSIRTKKYKGKKLDKVDQEFYNANKNLVNLKKKMSKAERQEIEEIRRKFGYGKEV